MAGIQDSNLVFKGPKTGTTVCQWKFFIGMYIFRILSECQRAFSQSAPPNGSDALADTMNEARSVTRFMRQMDTVSNVFKDGDYGNASKSCSSGKQNIA